ncbi:MAG: polyprenyl synthetase family protein [Deinococcus sp.]|nr:polyprenyl synthetase family protein [Deinococcus sp.]
MRAKPVPIGQQPSSLIGLTEAEMAVFETRLREVLRSKIEFVQLIEQDLVEAGGKRARPRLVFLAAGALGGVPFATELALSTELLHSATLLHDDLVDDAETRRGQLAAFRKYGNAVSVLAGDYLLSRLLWLLGQMGRLELVAMFAEAARQLSEAEVLQFQVAALADYSDENYQNIITGKTAALFQLCCEGAAVLADAEPEYRRALARFGLCYGQAFQMRDDYLDLMGTQERLGKPVGGDLREGKVTLITLRLLQRHREAVEPVLARRAAQEGDIEQMRTLARDSGVAGQIVKSIQQAAESAVAALAPFPQTPYKAALEALALAETERIH